MVYAAARSGQTQSVESSGESGELKEAFRLALRCWPYYRAQAKHLATFVLISLILGACVLGAVPKAKDYAKTKKAGKKQVDVDAY